MIINNNDNIDAVINILNQPEPMALWPTSVNGVL